MVNLTKIKEIKQIIKDLERLNKTKTIKIQDTKDERIIFNSEEVFKIFSNSNDESSLNPFNDYTYKWLNGFLCSFLDSITDEKDDINDIMRDFEDNISEHIDSEVEIYNTDLLKWLSDKLTNGYYMEEVFKEGLVNTENYDFFKHLQTSQYKAIEESYFSFLSSLKDYLNEKYELNL